MLARSYESEPVNACPARLQSLRRERGEMQLPLAIELIRRRENKPFTRPTTATKETKYRYFFTRRHALNGDQSPRSFTCPPVSPAWRNSSATMSVSSAKATHHTCSTRSKARTAPHHTWNQRRKEESEERDDEKGSAARCLFSSQVATGGTVGPVGLVSLVIASIASMDVGSFCCDSNVSEGLGGPCGASDGVLASREAIRSVRFDVGHSAHVTFETSQK